MTTIKAYAGVGSRTINFVEAAIVEEFATALCAQGYTCYSGFAPGTDQAFGVHSKWQVALMLPWRRFNHEESAYALHKVYLGEISRELRQQCIDAVWRHHPAAHRLGTGAMKLLARDYLQINGVPEKGLPPVDFVICNATPEGNSVKGGTRQAVMVAIEKNIPVFNIRTLSWIHSTHPLVEEIIEQIKNQLK